MGEREREISLGIRRHGDGREREVGREMERGNELRWRMNGGKSIRTHAVKVHSSYLLSLTRVLALSRVMKKKDLQLPTCQWEKSLSGQMENAGKSLLCLPAENVAKGQIGPAKFNLFRNRRHGTVSA